MKNVKLLLFFALLSTLSFPQQQSFLTVGNVWKFLCLDCPPQTFKSITCEEETTLSNGEKFINVSNIHYMFPIWWLNQDSRGIKIYNHISGDRFYLFEYDRTITMQLPLPAWGATVYNSYIIPEGMQFTEVFGEPDTVYSFRVIPVFDSGFKVSISRKYGFVYYEQYAFSTIYYQLIGMKIGGQVYGTLSAYKQDESYVPKLKLHQNFPNPSNLSTTIKYAIPKSAHTVLEIYDILGRCRERIFDEFKEPGEYEYELRTSHLSEANYFIKLSSGGQTQVVKLIILR